MKVEETNEEGNDATEQHEAEATQLGLPKQVQSDSEQNLDR